MARELLAGDARPEVTLLLESRYLLWRAGQRREDLDEAKRMLAEIRAQVSPRTRARMLDHPLFRAVYESEPGESGSAES